MKIVSILATPHGLKGSTASVLERVVQGAAASGAENETIVLKGKNVRPCMGCDHCHRKGGCVQKDAFEDIRRKIDAADGLILASPNYIFSVSAQLKAFMDRCCGILHCLSFEGKYGASVVTSGGGDEAPIAAYMNHFLITTGIVPVGAVWATMGAIDGPDLPAEIQGDAVALGARLVDAWQSKTRPPEVDAAMKAFKERMENLIRYRRQEWPYEYEYWVAHRNLK